MTDQRRDLLRARAAEYTGVALVNIRKEFPNDLWTTMRRPGDFPHRPKDCFPAFYGSFDWHSCVEMHWMLVRLLRTMPDEVPAADIRIALNEHLTAAALVAETATFRDRGAVLRPYAWAWALSLVHEMARWDDPDAQRWAANAAPLARAFTEAFLTWLPKATYPVRQGAHHNSAFGLSRALGYARWLAANGDSALLDAITGAAHRWFGNDADYPAEWEPDGTDFLSPALCEAELMANLLPADEFGPWLDRFLPTIADGGPVALRTPAVVSDDSDGTIAHLHGLNLSRAWGWLRLADTLPADDARVPGMLATAAEHATAELDNVSGSNYMVEHWLACYAVLYLSE
ncbi:MAG TPA: DUF2891 domain-containing protein [Pseudonocardiaceae bacterium]|nr:DUF2891 domain-containing protein [Pseudonocardiaceae bacterium]